MPQYRVVITVIITYKDLSCLSLQFQRVGTLDNLSYICKYLESVNTTFKVT